jgi:hypothetical protein
MHAPSWNHSHHQVEADVDLVFDPPWNHSMMSDAAKLETRDALRFSTSGFRPSEFHLTDPEDFSCFLEAIRIAILAHFRRIPHATVHGDINAIRQGLHGSDRTADVEHRIRTLEARGIQRTRQHNHLALDRRQFLGRFDHGVGAMRDQHVAIQRLGNTRRCQCADKHPLELLHQNSAEPFTPSIAFNAFQHSLLDGPVGKGIRRSAECWPSNQA